MAKAGLGHVALATQDPVALAAFYHDLFSMEIVGQHPQGVNAFVRGVPVEAENHELAFMRCVADSICRSGRSI